MDHTPNPSTVAMLSEAKALATRAHLRALRTQHPDTRNASQAFARCLAELRRVDPSAQ